MSCGGRETAPQPRRAPSLPQTRGELTVTGLSQPVRVVRDRWGIAHITAANEHDLFFAQGFVQAQDRLFQMDLWRRSAQGRLSQVLGPNFIDRDAMTRRVQYRGDLEAEWASYGSGARAIAEAFTTGINAWVVRARVDLPGEFSLAGFRPELWTPDDLLNRTDAFLASGDAAIEAFRAELAGSVGEQRAAALMPGDRPRGLPQDSDAQQVGQVLEDALRRVGTTPFFSGFASRFGGSNAWAIAASRSTSGAPMVASDPHRPLTNPSLRYLIHLQAPGWNVIGATSPWLPGVAIGHNERVAWGMAAAADNTQDIYAEPASAVVERVNDPIVVKGEAKPGAFEREYTRNGVVIASDRGHKLVFTLKWRGFEPGNAAELGALALDRASTLAELRDAIVHWKTPTADFVYADASGIGSSSPFVIVANGNPARVGRLKQLLGGGGRFTIDDIKRQQHDVIAWNAEQLVPRLRDVRSKDPRVEDARQQLLKWDRRVTADSPAARLYVAFERALWRKIAEARVPAGILDDYLGHAEFRVDDALRASNATLLEALSVAATTAGDVSSGIPGAGSTFRSGVGPVTFKHPLAITQAARRMFDVGPFSPGGYADTVLSITFRSNVDIGPSFRQILDVGDWDRSVATNAPGQVEWPASPHFSDLAKLWAAGEYVPLSFSEGAIERNAESRLTLRPR
jgi:penicillin amidase